MSTWLTGTAGAAPGRDCSLFARLVLGALAAGLFAGIACRSGPDAEAGAPRSDTAPFLARRIRLLEKEQALASGNAAYFVLDLGRKRLDLRMDGLTLRTWAAEAARCWGLAPGARDYTLARKSALNPPKRRLIRPAPPALDPDDRNAGIGESTAAPSAEPEALELDDMPAAFGLLLDGDLAIQVTTGERGRLGRLLDELSWHVWTPLQTLARGVRGRPFTRVRLTLADRTEARAVYWSLYEGIRGLILMPEPPPAAPKRPGAP